MRRRMNHADDGGGVWNKTNSAQPGEPLLFRGSLNYNKLSTTLLESCLSGTKGRTMFTFRTLNLQGGKIKEPPR
jgi:hypothetical protein